MSDNWQVGDHAICVEDCTFRDPRCTVTADIPDIYFQLGPRRGQRFIVTAVETHRLPENYEVGFEIYLRLREMPRDKAYLARQFRKLDPIVVADSVDIAEPVAQLEQVPV